jgi:hypothetical protein
MAINDNPQFVAPNPLNASTTLLHSTSAISVASGQVGQAGGQIGDTMITSVVLLKNAGPATLVMAGFKGEDGTSRNVTLTGSASVDTTYIFAASAWGGLVNTGAALTLTPSVADTVLVSLRPA